MAKTAKVIARRFSSAALSAAMCAATLWAAPTVSVAAEEAQMPSEVMLGIFFTSEEDMTDTLYVSFNGVDFRKIGVAYQDSTPNDRNESWTTDSPHLNVRPTHPLDKDWKISTLHDPALIYKDGFFWTMSGYSTQENGESVFIPNIGYSKDLVHWSFPRSGQTVDKADAKVRVKSDELPYGKGGSENNKTWDAVAPDLFVDDDGTVYIVLSMGYYAEWHGDKGDVMTPYLVKVTGLTPDNDKLSNTAEKGEPFTVSYDDAVAIRLPDNEMTVDENGNPCRDRIDGSLYKENGKYYLSIKRYGAIEELWSIDNIAECGNPDKWTLINENLVSGFEGPCLTRHDGTYFFYADRLAAYDADGDGNPDGRTGVHVFRSNAVDEPWLTYTYDMNGLKNYTMIHTYDVDGNEIATRHGSVLTVSDPEAVKTIMDRYYAAGWTYDPQKDKVDHFEYNGWYTMNQKEFWYENNVRQGYRPGEDPEVYRGKEIYDPASDGWYWLDQVNQGAKAVSKDVYQVSDAGKFADREDGTGKWVRYDDKGRMIKGEHLNSNGWYYFDKTYGAMIKGFVNIPKEGAIPDDWDVYRDHGEGSKWVFYDRTYGIMRYGEQYIDGQWYRFDIYSGEMAIGEWNYKNEAEGIDNWYYYATGEDEVLDGMNDNLKKGVMLKGSVYHDGNWYYYDEVTGIMQKGEVERDGNWYYYHPYEGWMEKGKLMHDGKWYYYDEVTGIMQKGQVVINGEEYYFDDVTGVMRYGEVILPDGTKAQYDQYSGVRKK